MPIHRKPWLHITVSRRRFGGLLAAAGALALTGCGGGSGGGGSAEGITTMTQPQSVSAVAGEVVQLEVVATGSDLRYQWLRDGVPITGATSSQLELVVQRSDDGARYSVRVSAGAASVESAVVTLTLSAAPAIADIELLAGGLGGVGFRDGTVESAQIRFPGELAAGPNGQWYFLASQALWRVSPDGEVRALSADVFASWINGEGAESSIGGTISGMTSDHDGNLFGVGGSVFRYQSHSNHWEVLPATLPTGSLFDAPAFHLAIFDASNRLHAFQDNALVRIPADGEVEVVAGSSRNEIIDGVGPGAAFLGPTDIAAMPNGELLVIDSEQWRLVTPDGAVRTLFGGASPFALTKNLGSVHPVAADDSGIWATDGHAIVRLGFDGSHRVVAGSILESGFIDAAGEAARFNLPLAILVEANGSLLVADASNHAIRRVDPVSGSTSTVIGGDGRAEPADGFGADASFAGPGCACVDAAGNYYVTDAARTLRKVTSAGRVTTPFSDFPAQGGIAIDEAGNFYGVRNHTIVKVAPDGSEAILAGSPGVVGFSDGNGASASFSNPISLCIDPAGDLLVLDAPQLTEVPGFTFSDFHFRYGNTVRRITPAGAVSTIVGRPGEVFENVRANDQAIALVQMGCDAEGNLYVAEHFSSRVKKYSSAGTVLSEWTVVGLNPLPSTNNSAIAVLPSGDVYLATQNEFAIFRLDEGGVVTRIADGASLVDHRLEQAVPLASLPGLSRFLTGLVGTPDGNLLWCSENAVLRFRLD